MRRTSVGILPYKLLGSFLAASFLSACSTFPPFYDQGRADASNSAKESFAGADVNTFSRAESNRLKDRLAEEIDAVRSLRENQVSLFIADLAASRRTTVASFLVELDDKLADLGYEDPAAARAFLKDTAEETRLRSENRSLIARIERVGQGKIDIPDCSKGGSMLAELSLPDDRTSARLIQRSYESYRDNCIQIQKVAPNPDGVIAIAAVDARNAAQEIKVLKKSLKERRKTIKEMSGDDGEADDNPLTSIGNRLDSVRSIISALDDDHPSIVRIESLQLVLSTAVGGNDEASQCASDVATEDGTVEEHGETAAASANQDLCRALTIVESIPALREDIAALRNQEKASLSHMILALNQERTDLARDEAELALKQKEALFARNEYDFAVGELRHLIRARSQACLFTRRAGGSPRLADTAARSAMCDSLTVNTDKESCSGINYQRSKSNCPLFRTFRDIFASKSATDDDAEAKRAVSEAVGAFILAHDAKTKRIVNAYRGFDVLYRRGLANNTAALQSRANIISTAIDRIDRLERYAVKPKAVADPIFEAAGLGAFTAFVVRDTD